MMVWIVAFFCFSNYWLRTPMGQGGGYVTEMENSYYGFLLRFITVYYGYYGTFLKDFIDSEPKPQKSPRNSNI